MTAAHINQLVKVKRPHLRIHYVDALACFFGVPVHYFFDSSRKRIASAEPVLGPVPSIRPRLWRSRSRCAARRR
jgi:hypothetical protein